MLLVAGVPVADVSIHAVTAGLSVRTECIEVVFFAVSTGSLVLILRAPRVLADSLQIAAYAPMPDGGIRRLCSQRRQTLVRGRVLRVVEAVHLQRGLEPLDTGF